MNSRWNWAEKREKKAFLALADGTVLGGYSVGAPVDATAFPTCPSGYYWSSTPSPHLTSNMLQAAVPDLPGSGSSWNLIAEAYAETSALVRCVRDLP